MALVVFEGADGVGKTTSLDLILSSLKASKKNVELIAYPAIKGTKTGPLLCDLLEKHHGEGMLLRSFSWFRNNLNNLISKAIPGSNSKSLAGSQSAGDNAINDLFNQFLHSESKQDLSRALLFALNRYETKDRILKSLEQNDLVLLDRYIYSNLAYNSDAKTQEFLLSLESEILDLPKPDLIILLDSDSPMKGDKNPGNHIYEKSDALQNMVLENYREFASKNNSTKSGFKWHVIKIQDSKGKRKTEEDVAKEIGSQLYSNFFKGEKFQLSLPKSFKAAVSLKPNTKKKAVKAKPAKTKAIVKTGGKVVVKASGAANRKISSKTGGKIIAKAGVKATGNTSGVASRKVSNKATSVISSKTDN